MDDVPLPTMNEILTTLSEGGEQLTNYISETVSEAVGSPNPLNGVKKSSLYAPLTQNDDQRHPCGVGLALALVHDPPLLSAGASPPPGTSVTYINVVDAVDNKPVF